MRSHLRSEDRERRPFDSGIGGLVAHGRRDLADRTEWKNLRKSVSFFHTKNDRSDILLPRRETAGLIERRRDPETRHSTRHPDFQGDIRPITDQPSRRTATPLGKGGEQVSRTAGERPGDPSQGAPGSRRNSRLRSSTRIEKRPFGRCDGPGGLGVMISTRHHRRRTAGTRRLDRNGPDAHDVV